MRPKVRPLFPFTSADIPLLAWRIYEHFFVEGNPQCMVGKQCVYQSTGCAIGCLLVAEDAEKLINTRYFKGSPENEEMFSWYFDANDVELTKFLSNAQDNHDYYFTLNFKNFLLEQTTKFTRVAT